MIIQRSHHTTVSPFPEPRMSRPIIAIPADIREFDGTRWHAVQLQYVHAAVKAVGNEASAVEKYLKGQKR